jgi:hypothetical protein
MLIYVVFVEKILVLVDHVHFGNDMDVHLHHFDVIPHNIKNVHVSIACVLVHVCLHLQFVIKKWLHAYEQFAHDVCQHQHRLCVLCMIQWLDE